MTRLFILILLLSSELSFSKSVVMPDPFLSPLVEARLGGTDNWIKLNVSGDHYYGARRMEKPVVVTLSPLINLNDVEFKLSTGVINRGPYVNVVNVSIVKDGQKFGFPATGTNFIGSYSKGNAKVSFNFSEVCDVLSCDFESGEYIYLYINYKGVREIKPIYDWEHIKGAYYLFRYENS